MARIAPAEQPFPPDVESALARIMPPGIEPLTLFTTPARFADTARRSTTVMPASWDDRLLPLLTDDWQSADALAARLHAKHFTVLARLKDLLRRNLVERRIVPNAAGKQHAGRPLQQAEFRRAQLGRSS